MSVTHVKHFLFFFLLLTLLFGCEKQETNKPNILFILMDDLGYGQFGVNNDTITTNDFNQYFVKLVDSLQGYSLEKSLEFTKTSIPTLSKLADEGVVFTNAYTSSSVCAPSRLGIATGCLQNKWGIYTNNDCENHGIVTGTHLVAKLKEQDYYTAHIGKWHIGKRDEEILKSVVAKHNIDTTITAAELSEEYPEVFSEAKEKGYVGSVIENQNPINHGFDYYFGYNHWASQYYNSYNVWENFEHTGKQKGYNTDVFTDKALDIMDKSLQKDKPFYIQLHYHAVHDSVEPKAPAKYFNKFDSESYHLNNFYAHIYGVDNNVKKIIKYLKDKGQYENTIIVFTSDNGAMCGGVYDGFKSGSPLPGNTPFTGHKGNLYMGGFRVPMFIHWPQGIKKSEVTDKLVSTMDILPTAIDAAGGNIPKGIDGKSLWPLIHDNKTVHKHLIWSGIHAYKWGYLINKSTENHATEDKFAPPAWVVIQGDYLLRYTGIREPGIYYDFMDGREAIIELYNIKKDPTESTNLVEQHPELVKELSSIYFNKSKDFPAPADWDQSNWEELKDRELFE